MNYLLILILSVINKDNLDVFTQSSVYNNKNATALIEMSSVLFLVWILFLVIYKIILSYLTKNEKEKINRIVVTKPIKVLPDNYEPIHVPNYSYGNIENKQMSASYQGYPNYSQQQLPSPMNNSYTNYQFNMPIN